MLQSIVQGTNSLRLHWSPCNMHAFTGVWSTSGPYQAPSTLSRVYLDGFWMEWMQLWFGEVGYDRPEADFKQNGRSNPNGVRDFDHQGLMPKSTPRYMSAMTLVQQADLAVERSIPAILQLASRHNHAETA